MNIDKFTKLNCYKQPCNKDFSINKFYKTTYFFCNECGNQFSVENKKLFFEKKFFNFFFKVFYKLTRWTVLNKFNLDMNNFKFGPNFVACPRKNLNLIKKITFF